MVKDVPAKKTWAWVLVAGTGVFAAHMVIEQVAAHTESGILTDLGVITSAVGAILLVLAPLLFVRQVEKCAKAREDARDRALTCALEELGGHLGVPGLGSHLEGVSTVTRLPQRRRQAG